MDIWVTGIVMAGLGYWAAHIRLTVERHRILGILAEARDVLVHAKARAIFDQLEADRSREDSDGSV